MTNFPFFYSCFLTNLVETKCGSSFEEVGNQRLRQAFCWRFEGGAKSLAGL